MMPVTPIPTDPDTADRRVRVALFLPSLDGGGAERVMVTLANGLSETGLEVDLVVAKAHGAFLKQLGPKVRLIDLDCNRMLFSLVSLARYLRSNRPAAMISAMYHANVVAIAAARLAACGVRVVATEHSTFDLVPAEQSANPSTSSFYALAMRLLYPFAHEIVAVSKGVAGDLKRVARLKVEPRIIYNPILSKQIYSKAQREPNHAWFAAGQPPVVLAVGRLDPVKGFADLIRAFALVRKNTMARLLILGEGDERANLQAQIDALSLRADVVLHGVTDNPYAYMKRACLLVLSSTREGLPTVLVEALGLGTPVVATDCVAGPSEILEAGRFGTLVPVGDVTALAGAISHVLGAAAGHVVRNHSDRSHLIKYTKEAAVAAYLDAASVG